MTPPNFRKYGQLFEATKPEQRPTKEETFRDLVDRIKANRFIPVISNSVQLDPLFAPLIAKFEGATPSETVEEWLSMAWSEQVGYPLGDSHNLGRVSQYHRLKCGDELKAKSDYLHFLKNILIGLAGATGAADADTIAEQREIVRTDPRVRLSRVAAALGVLPFPSPDDDPLRLLARLNLPIYVTTGHHDFMERALVAEERPSRTKVCLGAMSDKAIRAITSGMTEEEKRQERNFRPTSETPVVYHLYGYEDDAGSLVLSEDDYLRFLMQIAKPVEQNIPVIPGYLGWKLNLSTLVLLGYRLEDWDFRILFHGIIVKELPRPYFGVTLQLSPGGTLDAATPSDVERYFDEYFKPANFRVTWNESTQFICDLWGAWDRLR